MEESNGATVRAPSMTASVGLHATQVSVRGYRSSLHLWAARRAAREAREIEDERAGTHAPSVELEAAATNAVLLSVAFIEASVNEILQDAAESEPDSLPASCQGLEEDAVAMIKAVWAPPVRLERVGLLDKYQASLAITKKEPFDKGANPFQAAVKLVDLRNALVHFKPEWQMNNEEHSLEKKLAGLFPPSAIFKTPVHPWYPPMCLASGCAEWAHTTATALVDEWRRRMGLTWPFHADLSAMPAP